MHKHRKSFQKHALESALIFLLGCAVPWIYCRECFQEFSSRWPDIFYSGTLWLVLWKGNEWVAHFPDRFVSWLKKPVKRFFLGLFGHVAFTILALFALLGCFELLSNQSLSSSTLNSFIRHSGPAVIITIIIASFMTARSFLFSWRELAVRHEKLRTEAMASQFAALKNQLNPHFLFNSLNVLTGLVYKDADLSALFIKKLSEVYRYVLDSQNKEIIPITEELAFVQSFVFLQKLRFGNHLSFQVGTLSEENGFVAPLSLQMLVENAIKHNVISGENPLHIHIDKEEEFIVVKNSYKPKKVMPGKNGIGLKNIQSRYQYLSDTPVGIEQTKKDFIVKLPIITG